MYLYRLRMGDHEQTGVAACYSLAEYDNGVIKKHERTRRETPRQHRVAHSEAPERILKPGCFSDKEKVAAPARWRHVKATRAAKAPRVLHVEAHLLTEERDRALEVDLLILKLVEHA